MNQPVQKTDTLPAFTVQNDIDPATITMNSSETVHSVIHNSEKIDHQLSKDGKSLTVQTKKPQEFEMIGYAAKVTPTPAPTAKPTASPAPAAKNPFKDVAKEQYYYEPVLWAVKNGIAQGTGATTFSPANPCTRCQIVTFLYRAMK